MLVEQSKCNHMHNIGDFIDLTCPTLLYHTFGTEAVFDMILKTFVWTWSGWWS